MNKNREIKFRVWEISSKSWMKTQRTDEGEIYWASTKEEEGYPVTFDWLLGHDKHFTVQQFTGLKDSKGKEIYEGDIVNVNDRNHLIEWRGAGFFCSGSEYHLDTVWFRGGGPVVVGNVFDNPELMEK